MAWHSCFPIATSPPLSFPPNACIFVASFRSEGRCTVNQGSVHYHLCLPAPLHFAFLSVATMTSIPLHCNICPRAPDFSDLSHLLTHVASKGHLSHYSKAKLRARTDENVRYELDTYDQWYDVHQIEKLLSQRMSSKESRDSTRSRLTVRDDKPSKPARPTKRRNRKHTTAPIVNPTPSPVKIEYAIDPRLGPDRLPLRSLPNLPESPSEEAAIRHRSHVPRMLDRQTTSPLHRIRSSSLPPYHRSARKSLASHEFEDESDCLNDFFESPSRTIHPDLPDCSSFMQPIPQPRVDTGEEQSVPQASPVLKGIKYPGMSLFDSASQEAQRLRNQRKDGSVLQQMEIDSYAIEPMEHIYWPNGGLKKKRLITGNVESSPLREASPPPKRTRTGTRRVLAKISTNASRPASKRGRKPTRAASASALAFDGMADSALNTLQTAYPRNAHVLNDAGTDAEYRSLAPKASHDHQRKPAFAVFRDPPETIKASIETVRGETKANSYQPQLKDSARQGALPRSQLWPTKPGASTASSVTVLPRSASTPPAPARSEAERLEESAISEDQENSPIVFDLGDEEPEHVEPERATQRYFSVIGNQPPEFFSSMPPQMEFGGLAGPQYYGTSLNPLNFFLGRHYQQPHFSPATITQRVSPSALGQGPTASASHTRRSNHGNDQE